MSSELLRIVLTNITNLRGIDTLKYMLDNITIEEDASGIILRFAIYNNNTQMFIESLSLITFNGIELKMETISALSLYAVQKHNLDILQTILNLDVNVTKSNVGDLYRSISKSRTTGQVKASMLEIVLNFVSEDSPLELSEYESETISIDEVEVMLASNVLLDAFWEVGGFEYVNIDNS